MNNAKKSIIFFIIILAATALFPGCQKKQSQDDQAVVDEPAITPESDGKSMEVVSTAVENVNKEESVKGELIDKGNGLKRYQNSYFGIAFEYREKDNYTIIEIRESSDRITIKGNLGGEEPNEYYIYFSPAGYSDDAHYPDLKSFLDEQWKSMDMEQSELVSIEKVLNKNGVTFYEMTTNVSGGMQSPGKTHLSKQYFMDYDKFNNKNYLSIRSSFFNLEIMEDIINSLQFIKGN